MSLKRVLGMMLASRMAGRGRRRGGLGGGLGGLGSAAMLGGLGRRRGMGGKMGLAAMGFMAYRAYQDHQSRTAGRPGSGASAGALGGSGGIGGMIQDVADRFTGGGSAGGSASTGGAAEPDLREHEDAAERFSDDEALLLIRAMITAAYADGSLSQDERGRIMGHIDEAGGDAEDRRVMQREIADPRPLDELLGQVHDAETAQEFYLASHMAVDPDTDANRAYLADLRRRLGLSDEEANEVQELAS